MDPEYEDVVEDDVAAEEEFEQVDLVGEAEEQQTEAQRAEAADMAKLVRQHAEIWIPYEEQVLEQLNPQSAEEEVGANVPTRKLITNLRDQKSLDPKHKTYPFLTNYEMTKCISYRASQICSGAKPYILVPEGVTDAHEIAEMELRAKRLPFILKRPLPDGSFEVWRLSDLVIF